MRYDPKKQDTIFNAKVKPLLRLEEEVREVKEEEEEEETSNALISAYILSEYKYPVSMYMSRVKSEIG